MHNLCQLLHACDVSDPNRTTYAVLAEGKRGREGGRKKNTFSRIYINPCTIRRARSSFGNPFHASAFSPGRRKRPRVTLWRLSLFVYCGAAARITAKRVTDGIFLFGVIKKTRDFFANEKINSCVIFAALSIFLVTIAPNVHKTAFAHIVFNLNYIQIKYAIMGSINSQ